VEKILPWRCGLFTAIHKQKRAGCYERANGFHWEYYPLFQFLKYGALSGYLLYDENGDKVTELLMKMR